MIGAMVSAKLAAKVPATASAVLALAICALSPSAASFAATKTLRYAFEIAETGFDPAQLIDNYSRAVTEEIFEAPVRRAYLAAPGTLEPAAAASMPEVSADFKTITVHLKHGIHFTDDPAFGGVRRELVAEDFVYSYKRLFDPRWNSPTMDALEPLDILGMAALRAAALKTGHFDYDKPIEGLRALDRYTFQFKLGLPQPRFVDNNLSDASIMGAVAREVVERYGDAIMEHPVGTGPFRLAGWRRSSRIVLERNPGYRTDIFHVVADPADADAQRIARRLDGRRLPLLDRVEISIIEESQPRWLSFLNGDQDLLYPMPYDLADLALPGNRLAPNLAKKRIGVERQPRLDVSIMAFNMDDAVIGGYTPEKVALRRAISLGFDTQEEIRTYFKNQAFPAQTIVIPFTFGYDPKMRTELGVTDVARANAMLDEFGYRIPAGGIWRALPSGAPLRIIVSTQPDQRSRISEEIYKKSLTRLHLDSDSKVAKFPDNLKAVRAGNYQVWSLALTSTAPDSSPTLILAYGPAAGQENLSRFKLAAYDDLWRRQDRMADGPERAAIVRQMQKLLVAYAPMKYPVHRYAVDLTQPWVLNYRRWPFLTDFWRYLDIDDSQRPGAPAQNSRPAR